MLRLMFYNNYLHVNTIALASQVLNTNWNEIITLTAYTYVR